MEHKHLDGIQRARALAEKGLEEAIFLSQDRAINNYNKNNKHNKNEINTIKDNTGYASDNQQDLDFVPPWQASPREDSSPSQEAKRGNVSRASQTAYMKLDLFNNASDRELEENVYRLHTKLSIKKHDDPKWLHASASLNSEKRMAKRGLRMDDVNHRQHWETVEQIYTELHHDYKDTKVSKFYQSAQQKGKSIKGLSVVLSHQGEVAVVVAGTDVYPMSLSAKGLTAAQRKKHIIMSGTWTDDTVRPDNELNIDEWFNGR